MLLSLLIIVPFFSGIFSFITYQFNKKFPRWIAFIGIFLILLLLIQIYFQENFFSFKTEYYPYWNTQLVIPWIPSFGIEFNISIDGFSFVMVAFSTLLSMVAILVSWNEIKKNEGFFYLNFMFVLTGVIGVFISFDLFLFFCFWEVMLLPMYFLIALWNDQNEKNKNVIAANKFFIYGQISGLVLLSSILLLVFSYYQSNNILTFNYNILLTASIDKNIEYIVMLGFFLAFAIKMPIVPFHSWLPDVHVRSVSCGTVEIIGVLIKTAPYALLRYNVALFPRSTEQFSLIAMILGLISIFYGAWIAFSQTNIKRLIAYSSISHIGLMLIAIYSLNEIALQGLIIQILSNSISTAALCILSGYLYKRFQTQDINDMGGLWSYIYWIPGFTLFFSCANLGIPGTGNFIGEFLILSGTFQNFPFISMVATVSIVFSSLYSLIIIHKIFYGTSKKKFFMFSINQKELYTILSLILILIFIGINPQKIIDTSYNSIHNIQKEFNNSIFR